MRPRTRYDVACEQQQVPHKHIILVVRIVFPKSLLIRDELWLSLLLFV